jgi:hypothetical protein
VQAGLLTVKVFNDRRLEVDINALDVILHLPLEQFGDRSFRWRALAAVSLRF